MNIRSTKYPQRTSIIRWIKFNAVGALGSAIQIAILLGLKSGLHFGYTAATVVAVDAAVLHNFLWHERYTWPDCIYPSWQESFPRLLRFNLTNGLISIAGNLALMKLLVGFGHMNYLVANMIAIVACSLANFLVSGRWVFKSKVETSQHLEGAEFCVTKMEVEDSPAVLLPARKKVYAMRSTTFP